MIATAPEVRAALVAALCRIYAPGSDEHLLDWAVRVLDIPREESPDRAGPFSCDDLPLVVRLFRFINNPHEREFIVRKSAQKGFTLAVLIVIAYYAANAPREAIYGMPAGKDAAEICRRLVRLLRHNHATRHVFTGDPDDVTRRTLRLLGQSVHFVGVGVSDYRGRPAGLIIIDEMDAIERPPDQPHVIDQARSRIKDFQDSKLIAGGTPLAAEGQTQLNWLTGTREELHVPCPHCGHYQRLDFARLRYEHCRDTAGDWDYAAIAADTYLECELPGCSIPGRRIQNSDKSRMLAAHRWVVTNLGQDKHKPYPGRISVWDDGDMSSTRPQHSWGALALQWIGAQGDASKTRKFENEVLGLPTRASARTETRRDDLLALCGFYSVSTMPVPPARNLNGAPAIFMGVDNQQFEKKWVKVGFTAKGDRFLIDYGVCQERDELLSEADNPVYVGTDIDPPRMQALLEQARYLARTTGRHLTDVLAELHPGEWCVVPQGLYDEGYQTEQVREWCLSTTDHGIDPPTPRFFPVKGSGYRQLGPSAGIVVEKPGAALVNGIPLTVYHCNNSDLLHELYTNCIGKALRIRDGLYAHPRLWFPQQKEIGEDFLREMLVERWGKLMKNGYEVSGWLEPKTGEKNDYSDALKYTFALWHVVKRHYGWTDPAPAAEAATAEMDEHGRIIRPGAPTSPEDAAAQEAHNTPAGAIVYLRNVGGLMPIARFDEDYDPIGPTLRAALVEAGRASEADGHITLHA